MVIVRDSLIKPGLDRKRMLVKISLKPVKMTRIIKEKKIIVLLSLIESCTFCRSKAIVFHLPLIQVL